MMIKTNKTGSNQADNIIDNLLSFNIPSIWTVNNTGSASITNTNYFIGGGSLKIENTNPTKSITATNSTQSTEIKKDGDYWLSLMLFKELENTILSGDIKIFKNETLFNEQSFSISESNMWSRFIANQPFNFASGDIITFKITLDGVSGFTQPSTAICVDGIKLEDNDSGNSFPSAYSKPINIKQYIEQSDAPNVPLNNALNWVANSSGTSNGVTYEKGDYLLTINSDGIIKTTILINFSEL